MGVLLTRRAITGFLRVTRLVSLRVERRALLICLLVAAVVVLRLLLLHLLFVLLLGVRQLGNGRDIRRLCLFVAQADGG